MSVSSLDPYRLQAEQLVQEEFLREPSPLLMGGTTVDGESFLDWLVAYLVRTLPMDHAFGGTDTDVRWRAHSIHSARRVYSSITVRKRSVFPSVV